MEQLKGIVNVGPIECHGIGPDMIGQGNIIVPQ